MDSPAYARTRALPPHYREQMSRAFSFSEVGAVPHAVIQWVIQDWPTDVEVLYARLPPSGASGLSAAHEQALYAMLEAVVLANRALVRNNPTGAALGPEVQAAIESLLVEAVRLNPALAYRENTVRLLFRINAIDKVVAFIEANMPAMRASSAIRHVLGVIRAMGEEYEEALYLLEPMSEPKLAPIYPFADLCVMHARYQLKQWPQSPVRYDSLRQQHRSVNITSLPPLHMRHPCHRPGRPIVFLACDDEALERDAMPLLDSIHAHSREAVSVHVHLYASGKAALQALDDFAQRRPGMDIGVSYEIMPAPYGTLSRVYHANVRLLRAYEMMRVYEADLCVVDAGACFSLPWAELSAALGISPASDLVLLHDPHLPAWERISAQFIYAKASALGASYLTHLAAFILDNLMLGNARKFLDQIALYEVYATWFAGRHGVELRSSTILQLLHPAQT